MAFWVRGEDMVVGFVGPFETLADAEAHVAFCVARGDGSTMSVSDVAPGADEFVQTPEADRAFVFPK